MAAAARNAGGCRSAGNAGTRTAWSRQAAVRPARSRGRPAASTGTRSRQPVRSDVDLLRAPTQLAMPGRGRDNRGPKVGRPTADGRAVDPPLPLLIVRNPARRELLHLAEVMAQRRQVKSAASDAVVLQQLASAEYGQRPAIDNRRQEDRWRP